MQSPQLSARRTSPRLDLVVRRDRFAARIVTLIDRIGNRIVRLTAADWRRLQHCDQTDIAHDALWQQSKQAGLLNARSVVTPANPVWQVFNPLRWLAIRIPILSIDGFAQIAARHTDWLFSPLSILFGVLWYFVMLASVAVGWNQAVSSLHELIQQKQSLAGLGFSSLVVFVIIKLIHELAHGVACRRSGATVGYLGVIFFLGMPSPYCDVSAVAANDSRWSRAAVMAAGVYVEMLLASIATIIWWLTMFHDQAWMHQTCFQVMVISGVSTLLFNSNPLMKLDGYFVLSDVLNLPNLRQQGALAARTVAQVGMWRTLTSRTALRTGGLAIYHLLSTAYRLAVLMAITWFLLSLFNEWHLLWMGIALGLLVIAMMIVGLANHALAVLHGEASWADVRLRRRLGWTLCFPLAVLLIAMWPLQREIEVVGTIDVVDTQTVYAYEAGIVEEVCHEYGDYVQSGDPLVRLRNDDVSLQTVAVSNQKALAEMESAFLSRRELQKDQTTVSWELDQAKRNLLETQLVSLKQRTQQLVMKSPTSGVILPPAISDLSRATSSTQHHSTHLNDLIEMVVPRQATWCRIGDPKRVAAYCRLSPTQRQLLQVGAPVHVMVDTGNVESIAGNITSIEESLQPVDGSIRESVFIARCDLSQVGDSSDDGKAHSRLLLGCKVECHLFVESERVWQRVIRSLRELMTAPMDKP